MVAKTELETREQVWRLRVFDDAPLDRIAVLVGDTLHNLRQSLDHLAFSLAWKLREAEPPENTGFPLADDPSKFEGCLGNLAPRKLMSQPLIDALERVQPYNGGNYRLLLALKELHDRDKHREPTMTAGGAAHEKTGLRNVEVRQGGMTLPNPRGFTEDGEPLLEITGIIVPDSNFYVDFEVTADVAFGGRTPIVPKQPVLPVLASMRILIVTEIAEPLERFL